MIHAPQLPLRLGKQPAANHLVGNPDLMNTDGRRFAQQDGATLRGKHIKLNILTGVIEVEGAVGQIPPMAVPEPGAKP